MNARAPLAPDHLDRPAEPGQWQQGRLILDRGALSRGETAPRLDCQSANRGAYAIAERRGSTPQVFPGGHDGFLGGEYGQMGKPDEFAAKLREVLSAA